MAQLIKELEVKSDKINLTPRFAQQKERTDSYKCSLTSTCVQDMDFFPLKKCQISITLLLKTKQTKI